jgi:hypothetical protein
MAQITVKDLMENAELDRKAMLAIVGGRSAAGPRLGFTPPPSGYFQNPLSFGAIRLLPGTPDTGLER